MELVRQVELEHHYKALDWKMRGWRKKKLEILFTHTTLGGCCLLFWSRTGFSPNLTHERYRKSGVTAVGEGSHQRFQFPTEVRRKSCSAVVSGKKEGCLAFERQSPASSSSAITAPWACTWTVLRQSDRTHTHLSAVWVKYVYNAPPRSNGAGKANKRPVSHPDDIPMWRKIKLRVKLW